MCRACLGGRTEGRLREGAGLGQCWRIEGAIARAPKTLHALGTLILQFGGGSGLGRAPTMLWLRSHAPPDHTKVSCAGSGAQHGNCRALRGCRSA